MRYEGNSNTPWQKLLKIIANPVVEVVMAIVVVVLSAWVVIETETDQQRKQSVFPVLFGHK